MHVEPKHSWMGGCLCFLLCAPARGQRLLGLWWLLYGLGILHFIAWWLHNIMTQSIWKASQFGSSSHLTWPVQKRWLIDCHVTGPQRVQRRQFSCLFGNHFSIWLTYLDFTEANFKRVCILWANRQEGTPEGRWWSLDNHTVWIWMKLCGIHTCCTCIFQNLETSLLFF